MFDFIPSNDTKYAYTVGVVRSLETKLLKKNHWERLVDSKNEEEIFMVLSDTPYASLKRDTVEETLKEAEKENEFFLKKMIIDEPIINFFRMEKDYYNLKALLREEIFKTKVTLKDGGRYTAEEIKKALKGEKVKIDEDFIKAIAEGLAIGFDKKDPLYMDITVDKYLFSERNNIAKGFSFLFNFLKLSIDMENIRNFLRFKKNGLKEMLPEIILDGGKLRKKFFMEFIEEPDESFVSELAKLDYTFIQEGYKHLKEKNSFSRLERGIKEFLNNWISQTKYLVFGYEPVVTYYIKKEDEITRIRRVLTGIKANFSKEEIREGVWETQ